MHIKVLVCTNNYTDMKNWCLQFFLWVQLKKRRNFSSIIYCLFNKVGMNIQENITEDVAKKQFTTDINQSCLLVYNLSIVNLCVFMSKFITQQLDKKSRFLPKNIHDRHF